MATYKNCKFSEPIVKTKKFGLYVLIGLLLIGVIIFSGCIECGDLNQNCCEGTTCNTGYACGADGKCYECGNVGELCCAGDICDEGACSDGKCEMRSAKEDMERAASIMNTAKERIEKISFVGEYVAYSDIKNKLDASKTDYEEALKILKDAKTDYDDEKKGIETNKIICEASLDNIDATQKFVVGMEHLEKGASYMMEADIEKTRSEFKSGEKAFDDSLPLILKAKEKINSIDMSTIPPESKSNVQEVKRGIEEFEKRLPEFKKMMSGIYPFLDGMEHFLDASDYMDNENWHSAELKFKEASANFSKSKDIFEDLKDSEFTELSVSSIQLYGVTEAMIEFSDHMEAGCGYMDQGEEEKANEEFESVASSFIGI